MALDDGSVIDKAACLSSTGFSGWFAMMGFGFIFDRNTRAHAYLDVSEYTGIRFWGYSHGREQDIKVGFADRNTYTEDPRSTCNQNPDRGRCGDDWAIQHLTLDAMWKEYRVKWSDLRQSPDDWGQARFEFFDTKHVLTTYFAVMGKGPDKMTPPFDFCISRLYFTQ